MRKTITTVVLLLLAVIAGTNTTIAANNNRYVVMISLDGYRWDYPGWYDTPLMDLMAAEGVEAGLIPSFPSKTFPNHYTLATGLVPDHHGIIHNSFYDRKADKTFSLSNLETKLNPLYWGGEPIWLTAKHQGVRTAVFYWPGSDIPIKGEYPEIYHVYDKQPRLTVEERFNGILDQLKKPEAERPHLIMAYSEEPDHCGHNYGPHGKETRHAVQEMDSLLNVLYHNMMALPIAKDIDFIVLSDHGMAIITPEQQVRVDTYLKPEWYTAIEGNMPANIYVRKDNTCNYTDSIINALKDVQHISVWKKGQVPTELNYGTNDNCGDVIVSPDLGWIFYDGKVTVGGMHGFDPAFNDMHALFRAVGPDFKNIKREHFRNVNIYPLVCHILGITPAANDGNLMEINDILR